MIPDVKLSRETIIKLNYVRLVLHMLLLWACIFSFFMLATRFGVQLYYKCFLVSAALSIMNLFLTYGKPSMDQSYLLRVSTDDANHNILCCLAFYISVPSAGRFTPHRLTCLKLPVISSLGAHFLSLTDLHCNWS
eukprot:TRINITY_DN923_c0_g1_i1.p1 TRINITY_DN923_c0_g1~~TRINITY_DN923_c0_g1_i1.p1  ORF type:complete len:135 (-),score=28.18 TRINITY_DN923_c0_g1_i1:472-876(-)